MMRQYEGTTVSDRGQVVLEAEPGRRLSYSWQTITREFADAVGFTDEYLARAAAESRSRASFDRDPGETR